MRPDDILPTYEKVGPAFAASRNCEPWEKPLLDWLLRKAPGPKLLDIGCGGLPIARYLVEQGAQVTAMDGAHSMVALCRENVPDATVLHADMRAFDLGALFDGLIAFNSFFHLSPADQTKAFACFLAHAKPSASLILTTGPEAGEKVGAVEGEPVYHASLSPADYRALFAKHGWQEQAFLPEDPTFRGHTIWQLRKN
ncbi:trans-aconitate 2-methyltransferase [Cognatishimia sp. MH4019]|uniref:class I SAM-dependent methyltransferase n=1 Tax=Cognatishimia sp. MH4019 TaxID=2854030 RepID=UPI001CD4A94F|nr:class I SAM-dependent methyltransferase [Cognatishimia sp. MH4019]